jgi:large subunit ribosomal protein L3
MAGRLGGQQVTTLNLEVVQADPERQIVLVRGAVPGPRGGIVLLRDTVKGANAGARASKAAAS